MRLALTILLTAAIVAVPACHKQQAQPQEQEQEQEQNIAIDEDGMSNGGLPANAEIEQLPPDESSGTSSTELQSGEDNPDVNDLNASGNAG